MKKILSVLMCAFLCVTLFIVPMSASASEEDTVLLERGTYKFNEIPFETYALFSYLDALMPIYVEIGEIVIDGQDWVTYEGFETDYFEDTEWLGEIEIGGEVVYQNGEWLEGFNRQITITEDVFVEREYYNFFTSTTNYYDVNSPYCDGSTCSATDPNGDNICDDCGKPFTFSLRNDTYDFNGYHFATTFELGDGSTTTLNELWAGIKDSGGNVFIINDTWENALFYIVSPADNMQVVGNSYQTKDRVIVTLYSSETTEDGTPYWKYTATDTRNNAGANLATLNQIIWTAENLNDQYGFVVVDGDINFMTPLWEKVEQVTQGELPNLTTTLGGNLMTLTLCGVGLITLLVGLYLLLRVLRTYLKT